MDEEAERTNFQCLCPEQRGRAQELTARMAGSFDAAPDQMLPAAVRSSREVPELLNNAVREGAATPITVSRRGHIIHHGPDAEEPTLQRGDVISRPNGEWYELMGEVNRTAPPFTIAFALDRHGMHQQVSSSTVMTWLNALFCHDVWERPEYKWYKIPVHLLSSPLEVAYVNFTAFMERSGIYINFAALAAAPRTDNRPLITPQWQAEHPEEWQRLWDQHPRNECPVCHEKPDIWDGPMT